MRLVTTVWMHIHAESIAQTIVTCHVCGDVRSKTTT